MLSILTQQLPQQPSIPPQAQQLLDRLKDIHAPEPVGFWPPAPGWWVLFVLALGAVVGLVLWLWRRHQNNRYRREAIRELAAMPFEQTPEFVARISELLKRTAISAYPDWRHFIGQLFGERWPDFLKATCESPGIGVESAKALAGGHYQQTLDTDVSRLKADALHWVKTHKSPGSAQNILKRLYFANDTAEHKPAQQEANHV